MILVVFVKKMNVTMRMVNDGFSVKGVVKDGSIFKMFEAKKMSKG